MKPPRWSPFAWFLFDLQRTITFGYLRQRWTRAALIVVSIALGVAILVATRALNQNLNKAAQSAAVPLSAQSELLVVNGMTGVPISIVERLRAAQKSSIPEILDVQPLVLGRVAIPELDNRSVLMIGLQPPDLAAADNPETKALTESLGIKIALNGNVAAFILGKHPVLLRKELADRLGARADSFHVALAGHQFAVASAGTVSVEKEGGLLEEDTLFLDIKDAAALVFPQRPAYVTQINIRLRSKNDTAKVQQQLQALVPAPCKVETLERSLEGVRDITAGVELGFSTGGAVALVVGLFLVYLVLSVSVAERRHDIGILRSVGATRGQIASLFVMEAAVLGLVGSLLALPLGYGLAQLGLGPMSRILSEVFVPLDAQPLELSWRLMSGAIAAGVLTTVLAALLPALQAASQEPADAVRRVPIVVHLLGRIVHLGASGALVGAGLACVLGRDFLPLRVGVFLGIVLVLLGLLVLAPLLAVIVGRFLQPLFRRVLGVAARLAADNLVRSPTRTGLVIAFLAATGGLMVETAGFINSTDAAIFDWLDDKIAADLFVTAASPVTTGTTALPMDEELGDRLRTLPQVRTVLPVRTSVLEYQNRIVLLIAIDADAFDEPAAGADLPPFKHGLAQTLRDHPQLRRPGKVMVSENFAALYHKGPGDHIQIDGPDRELDVEIVGTLVDYSWNRGSIIMDRRWYREQYKDPQVNVFDVYLKPGSDPDAVQREMTDRWGKSDALAVISRSETLKVLARQLRQVYGMAYAQEGVVGLVSLLGVVSALFISVLQRRRELGLLLSIGATRPQVLGAVLAEAILMGAIGAVLGFGIGLLLEWYLLDLVLFDEAGFTFPLRVPWLESSLVMGSSIVLATLVGLWPAYYATRMRIAEAIQYE